MPSRAVSGPGVLDALSLLAEVTDDLVVGTVRDTHLAVVDRVHGLLGRPTLRAESVPGTLHRTIASSLYAGLGLSLRAASAGLDRVAALEVDPRLEADPRGRFLHSAVNGLIGDRLDRERPQWSIPMAVRVADADLRPTTRHLAEGFPHATGRLAVFLHGLCEDETCWGPHRDRVGPSYPDALAARGWTPVLLRANAGLPVRANGACLAGLLQELTDAWPVPVERIALVGHSMGGLVIRAACTVRIAADEPWVERVTDVVCLGTPHLGAPLAAFVGRSSSRLGWLPESAAFGRILDQRSAGVRDLVEGLLEEVPPLPRARYRLVSGSVTTSRRNPVGAFLGDGLVRVSSAQGRHRRRVELFPGADVLHLPGAGHFDLLRHPQVQAHLEEWLS